MDIETITPAMAKKYLATRKVNRILSEAKILEYAIAIEQGHWVLNGETIKFNGEGALIDGQHRLLACELAEKPFQSYVVRHLKDARAMATVDTGKARTHTDVWTIAGHQWAALGSSIAAMVMLYEQGRITWNGFRPARMPRTSPVAARMKARSTFMPLSKEELLAYGEAHMEPIMAAAQFVGSCPVRKVLSPQAAGALWYFAERKDRATAEAFLNDVGSGIGLQTGDPALVLREHVFARTKAGAKLHRAYIFGMLVKAWNARRAGITIKLLKVGAEEEFPKIK